MIGIGSFTGANVPTTWAEAPKQSNVSLSLQRKQEDLDRLMPTGSAISSNTPFAGFNNNIWAIPWVTQSAIDTGVTKTGLGEATVEQREGANLIPTQDTVDKSNQFQKKEQDRQYMREINETTGLSRWSTEQLETLINRMDIPEAAKASAFDQLAPGYLERLSQIEGNPEYTYKQEQKMQKRTEKFDRFNLFGGREIPQIGKFDTEQDVKDLEEAIKDDSFSAILDAPIQFGKLGIKTTLNAMAGGVNIISGLVNAVGNAGSTANALNNIRIGAVDLANGKESPEAGIVETLWEAIGDAIYEPMDALIQGDPKPIVEAISENPEAIIETMTGLWGTRAAVKQGVKWSQNAVRRTANFISDIPENLQQLRRNMARVDDQVAKSAENITQGDFDLLSQAAKAKKGDVSQLWAMETVSSRGASMVGEVFTAPKNKLWEQLWRVRQAAKEAGKDLSIDTKPALSSMDEVIQDRFNLKANISTATDGSKSIDFVAWSAGDIVNITDGELKLIKDLYTDLSNPTISAADVDAVFDKFNNSYKTFLKSNNTSASNDILTMQRQVRSSLDEGLENIYWPEYKQLRKEYGDLAEQEQRFSNLFTKKKAGAPGERVDTIGMMKKLFSPDSGAVIEDFKAFEEATWVDFISQARVSKFLDEASGNNAVRSLLDDVPTNSRWILDKAINTTLKKAFDLVSGWPEKVARSLTKNFDELSEAQKVEVMNYADDIIENAKKYKNSEDFVQWYMKQIEVTPTPSTSPSIRTQDFDLSPRGIGQ